MGTNGDRIRAMNDAELAVFMNELAQDACQSCCFAGESNGLDTDCMAPPTYDCARGYQEWLRREVNG